MASPSWSVNWMRRPSGVLSTSMEPWYFFSSGMPLTAFCNISLAFSKRCCSRSASFSLNSFSVIPDSVWSASPWVRSSPPGPMELGGRCCTRLGELVLDSSAPSPITLPPRMPPAPDWLFDAMVGAK